MSHRYLEMLFRLRTGDLINFVHRHGDLWVFHTFPSPDPNYFFVKYVSEAFPVGTVEVGPPDFRVWVKGHKRMPRDFKSRISEKLWNWGR